MSSSSIGVSGMPGSAPSPSSASNGSTPSSGDGASPARYTCSTFGRFASTGFSTSRRLRSATTTFASQSFSANSSSSPFCQAFSGTQVAPRMPQAQNTKSHSGVLALTIATRSPRPTPAAASECATDRAIRSCSPYVKRRSPCTRNVTSARSPFCSISSRMECMRLRYTWVGTPRTSSTTISMAPPGPVSWAIASCNVGTAPPERRTLPRVALSVPGPLRPCGPAEASDCGQRHPSR